jgi:hypothetical protein
VTAVRAIPPADADADLVAGYIARWRPSSVSPQAAAFARQVVPAAGPGGRERAKNLLWAAGRLADYAVPLGLATFMHAAGITCSQRLGDLLASLEPAGEQDAIRLLGAARRP